MRPLEAPPKSPLRAGRFGWKAQVATVLTFSAVIAWVVVLPAVMHNPAGAYQYLTKPVNFQEVVHVVEQAVGSEDLARENRALKERFGEFYADE